jgi:secreted PhoX family phosphatase
MKNLMDTSSSHVDFNNDDSNRSGNPTFDSIFRARLSRRNLLRGGLGLTAGAVLPAVGLAGCGSDSDSTPAVTEKLLGFAAVPKSLSDVVSVPAGYSVSVLYALGDPLTASASAYKNDGTDSDFEQRGGDHHDGMEWFGLSSAGTPSTTSVDRGLLAINHEATTDERLSSFFLHANGGTTTLPRPASEVDKEVAVHGTAVVEVRRNGNTWEYV